jgi:predicted transposase YbfD/YdcC
MDRAQLFKRLYDLSLSELSAVFSDKDDISRIIIKLDVVARTRKILNTIQVEDFWQESEDESQLNNYHLSMKLSPHSLEIAFPQFFQIELNTLEWNFVFPKNEDIAEDKKPKNFAQYVQLMKAVNVMDIDNYSVESLCSALDLILISRMS